jgi:hypothetical protein
MQRDPRPIAELPSSLDARRAGRRGEGEARLAPVSLPVPGHDRPKVIPLPRAHTRPPEGEGDGRTVVAIDLQAPIDTLRSMKGDLEAYYWDRVDGAGERGERYQIHFWIRLLTDRTAALESIILDKETPRIFVTGLTPADAQAIEYVSSLLQQCLPEDEPLAAVAERVGRLLAAADHIALRAASGRSTP